MHSSVRASTGCSVQPTGQIDPFIPGLFVRRTHAHQPAGTDHTLLGAPPKRQLPALPDQAQYPDHSTRPSRFQQAPLVQGISAIELRSIVYPQTDFTATNQTPASGSQQLSAPRSFTALGCTPLQACTFQPRLAELTALAKHTPVPLAIKSSKARTSKRSFRTL